MQTEIEAKFLAVDHETVREKLRRLGAACEHPSRLLRRKNYDYPDARLDKKGGWVRLRDEDDKVTLSYKQLGDRGLHGTKEVSLIVSGFAAADELLVAIGLVSKSYQETKRESWTLHDAQIELDEWPWIKPFLEIEGPTEASVRHAADLLGLRWNTAVHGSVEVAYQAEYDITEHEINNWPEILFDAVPDWLVSKRRAQENIHAS